MWDTWEELACRPVILSSTLVVFGPAMTVMVPFEVTEESAGLSLKLKTLPGVGDLPAGSKGLGVGKAADPGEAPQAAAHSKIEARASQHRVLGIPQQVTGAGREFSSGPLAIFGSAQTWCAAAGAGRRRVRQNP